MLKTVRTHIKKKMAWASVLRLWNGATCLQDKTKKSGDDSDAIGLQKPSLFHATMVIFLEFFAWGLLTTPILSVINKTFPHHTLLMNGLVHGIKGFLAFLSAPLIGALSDVWGRKSFLLVTVFFTCLPIPLLVISPWWYFALFSFSGLFAVTFSVVFAYVSDITEESNRSAAYGQVSATFAASFVVSPAIGAYLSAQVGDGMVVFLASAIALIDLVFIWLIVPESLPERMRPAVWGAKISWEQADPFASLRKAGQDRNLMVIFAMVFLSYLPEAGQYSCFFVYLSKVAGFTSQDVALFIALVGCLSIISQTVIMSMLVRTFGHRSTIIIGLTFQALQLMWYGLSVTHWMLWAAGVLAALSSITYPTISALASSYVGVDQQGVVQGIITGVRGLCTGLGPALFGLVFHLFHVHFDSDDITPTTITPTALNASAHNRTVLRRTHPHHLHPRFRSAFRRQGVGTTAGAPFLIGAFIVLLGLLVTMMANRPRHKTGTRHARVDYSFLSPGPDHKESTS